MCDFCFILRITPLLLCLIASDYLFGAKVPSFNIYLLVYFVFGRLHTTTVYSHEYLRDVCTRNNARFPQDEFSWCFVLGDFYSNISAEFKFGQNPTKVADTLREALPTRMIS